MSVCMYIYIRWTIIVGNKYAMPVQYRSLVIKIWIDRLLRSGYKCVVFSDTDEIVAANPLVYHRGLADYLRRFTSDNVTDFAMRVTAIEVAHMAYGKRHNRHLYIYYTYCTNVYLLTGIYITAYTRACNTYKR